MTLGRLVLINCVLTGCRYEVPPSPIEVAATHLDFGVVENCGSVTRTFSVTNITEEALRVEVPPIDGFTLRPAGPQQLEAFGIVVYEVTFTGSNDARDIDTELLIKRVGIGVLDELRVTASNTASAREERHLDYLGVGVDGGVTLEWALGDVSFEGSDDAAFSTSRTPDGGRAVHFAPTEAKPYEAVLTGQREGLCPLTLHVRGDGVSRSIEPRPLLPLFTGRTGTTTTLAMTLLNFGRERQFTGVTASGTFTTPTTLSLQAATRDERGELQPSRTTLQLGYTHGTIGTWDHTLSLQPGDVTFPLRAITDP